MVGIETFVFEVVEVSWFPLVMNEKLWEVPTFLRADPKLHPQIRKLPTLFLEVAWTIVAI